MPGTLKCTPRVADWAGMRINKESKQPMFDLFQRREIWLPTWRGWVFILLVGAGLSFLGVREVHPFLAVTDPVSGGALVAEGWLPDYAFEKVIDEFKRNQYDKLYVTGGPIELSAVSLDPMTYANRGAAIARSKGMPSDLVQEVPAPRAERDRTYASAVALKSWLLKRGITAKNYHIMTLGPHARRTRLLFEEALGDGVIVGITAIDDPSYDSKHWWNSSVGVRTVVGEAIAYGYARLLF